MIDGQMDFFGLMPDASERETLLKEACRRGSGIDGGHVRIWAMLEGGAFPQYRERWMADEFGIGGHSMEDHWFADYNARGMKISNLRSHEEYSYTWREVVRCMQQLISAGDFLRRKDEEIITGIAAKYGRPPYPRPRLMYPECAWGANDEPRWRDETEDENEWLIEDSR